MTEIEIPIYHDAWMDNGIETFYRIAKNSVQNGSLKLEQNSLKISIRDVPEFAKQVGKAIMTRRQSLVVWGEDKKTGEKKEIKKDFILIQEGSKIGGKVAFREEIYNESKTISEVDKILQSITEHGKKRCVVCGNNFSKPHKNLQQATYPFVTKIKSLSGVRSYSDGETYSFQEYFTEFCPTCYLMGVLVWQDGGMIHRTFPRDKSLLFLPIIANLKDLHSFKSSYISLLNNSSEPSGRYSNIKVRIDSSETENTPGRFSTLLCFYEKFFNYSEEKSKVGNDWALMEIPLGTVKNVKYNLFSLDDEIMSVIKEAVVENEESIYTGFIRQTYFFYDNPKGAPVNWDRTNEIQERLSESLLKDDFRGFSNALLPRKGGHVGFSQDARATLENLIYIWRWKRMSIPKQDLETIKSVGNIISKTSKNNLSLLYKLDKTRSLEEFWGVLRQISRKLVGLDENDRKMIKPTALDGLIQLVKEHEKSWGEIRDLLVVYSSMYYSIGIRKEGA